MGRPGAETADIATALAAHHEGRATRAETKLLVKHFLAQLVAQAPGKSVEVRVPPYAAVQAIPGIRHTRGTPPAVVEMDAAVWIALATGRLTWEDAVDGDRISASGERADLAPYLPLVADA